MRQDELERIEKVKQGLAVVANKRSDHGLIAWAENEGLATKVDRSSKYGNPFVMKKESERDLVCDRFEDERLPLLDVSSLQGRVLICWCYPKRCHGDCLANAANQKEPTPKNSSNNVGQNKQVASTQMHFDFSGNEKSLRALDR